MVDVLSTKSQSGSLPSIKLRPFEILSSYKLCEVRLRQLSGSPLPLHAAPSQRETKLLSGQEKRKLAAEASRRPSENGASEWPAANLWGQLFTLQAEEESDQWKS